MTAADFDDGFRGGSTLTPDGLRRNRDVVAEAFDKRAAELQAAGRPDKAGVVRSISIAIRGHKEPSKAVKAKARKEIEEVRTRLVGGDGNDDFHINTARVLAQ